VKRGRSVKCLRTKFSRIYLNTEEINSGEEAKGWRKLHNEELRNAYSSQYIIIIIKSNQRKRV
jgi:hypothetical protein